MKAQYLSALMKSTNAQSVLSVEPFQELWSGYGQISRLHLDGAPYPSIIVKHVQLGGANGHPRGWNTDFGHQRKLKSYQVETKWYEHYSGESTARLPKCYGVEHFDEEVLILLEDLDAAGFPIRKNNLAWPAMKACIKWLAEFHASFMGSKPEGLWEEGTYWHLATRPQELEALNDEALKGAAAIIATKLKAAKFQTLVHGDAKLANFCFASEGEVAAVDFQYVGGGCGMKDLAYFVGSCLGEEDCERYEQPILDYYFEVLREARPEDGRAIEAEWRPLYPYAWADFHRFLKGWSPGHWKINSYSERICKALIKDL